MSSQDLEALLGDRSGRVTVVPNRALMTPQQSRIQTAEKNCNLFDFIKMVENVVTKTMKDLNVDFVPDENRIIATSPDLEMDRPMITYKIISRKPDIERKPRRREGIQEKGDEDSDRVGEIYGQKFKSIIQFNVFASVYDLAEQVMEKFEEAIFTYTGYFKKNGVSELFFEEQLTDTSYDIYRQKISVRNLRYYVETEKLFVLFQERIREIETNGL